MISAKLKLFNCVISVVLLISIILGGSVVRGETEMSFKTLNFLDYKNQINFYGRCAIVSNGYKADTSGGGIFFALDCEGTVTINLNVEWSAGFIGAVIDDDFDNPVHFKVVSGRNSIVIAKDLQKGIHSFRLIKLSPWYTNLVTFESVEINGEFAAKPIMKSLKIEYFGDSITSGVGSVKESDGKFYDNALGSYAYYCSKYLNAEFSLVSAPGYGYMYGYDTGPTQSLDKLYEYSLFNQKVAWDYSNYDADVVVVYLGTNDINYSKNKNLITEDADVIAKVKGYIDYIRTKNSDCKIVIMESGWSLNDKLNGPYLKLTDAIKHVASLYNEVYTVKVSLGYSGGGWHPTKDEAAKNIIPVADFIKNNVLRELQTTTEPTTEPTTQGNTTPTQAVLLGDVNSDTKINSKDVLKLRKYLINFNEKINFKNSDVIKDSKLNLKDVLQIKKYISKQISAF